MDIREKSDDMQSEFDETMDDDDRSVSSDNDSSTMQDFQNDKTFSTISTSATSDPSSCRAQYPISSLQLLYPSMNINALYYTDPHSAAFIVDDRNIGNYEEVSSYSTTHPFPLQPSAISLFSDIPHGAVPSYAAPLSSYPVADYVSSQFQESLQPVLPSDTTNPNLSVQIGSAHAIQNDPVQDEPMQKVKKRGRKRLSENAAARAIEVVNVIPKNSIQKKRKRKRKESVDNDIGGEVQEVKTQYDEIAMNQTKMGTKIISNVAISSDISAPQNDEISIKQTNTEKTIISEDEKKPKRHARKKNDGESAKTKTSTTKKQCMEELLQKQKSRMAFPKGSFLIRYCDLETLECDKIWCVDNHHMLLKYRLSTHIEGKRRLYLKSQPERFVGWKCEEPWHFHELTVLERDRDGSRVLVLYPDAKELAECRERARRQKQIAEEKKRNLSSMHSSNGTNPDDSGENLRIQSDGACTDPKEQRLQQQRSLEVQMVDEAANAIERFILIPETDYSEASDERLVETVSVAENPVDEHASVPENDN